MLNGLEDKYHEDIWSAVIPDGQQELATQVSDMETVFTKETSNPLEEKPKISIITGINSVLYISAF